MLETTISGDAIWVLTCGFIVLLMQAGFTCLESGMVRAKNSINVAIKNLIDFCIASAIFCISGFALMFGHSYHGMLGTSHFLLSGGIGSWLLTFFFFQAVFCGTSTTIVSGAVAERMRFSGYCLTAIIISGLIYPVVGHWAWGGALYAENAGWLQTRGFIDFAGSTVVHSVGGWVALAAILVIGPRRGRFGKRGNLIEGYNLPTAVLGTFLLWFGWFGFNGGSTLGLSPKIPLIIVNTTAAGATGGLAALLLSWWLMGRPVVDRIINGVLAGLVSITASCHLVTPITSLLIGAIGGAVCVGGMAWLERCKIDDAIGAVPTHLFAGIWGTLAVALCADPAERANQLPPTAQLLVQLEGILAVALYAFTLSFVLLKLLQRVYRLRVTAKQELVGLNVSEHGARTAVLDLITQLEQQARTTNFHKPVVVEPETEAAQIAAYYNAVREKFQSETDRHRIALQKLTQLAHYDPLTGLANRNVLFEEIERALRHAHRNRTYGALLYMDLDGFKKVNDALGHALGDALLRQAAQRIATRVLSSDLLARLGGDEFALLMQHSHAPDSAVTAAEDIIELFHAPFPGTTKEVTLGISIGIASFGPDHQESVKSLLRKADQAMYAAKLGGKNTYRWYSESRSDLAV